MIAFVFPGQGSQTPHLLAALRDVPGGALLVDRAATILQRDLWADDSSTAPDATDAAQRALFIAGVASARALVSRGLTPDAVAGHSVGTFAAAVIAGCIDFEVALRIVDLRGRAMAAAFPSGFGMGAIVGLDETRVADLVRASPSAAGAIYCANVNAGDQVTIAGSSAAIDGVLVAAQALGARSIRHLAVRVPSHSPLMDGVAATLTAALPANAVREARIPYAANATGRIVRDAGRVRDDLTAGVRSPVRWADATQALYEAGVRTFIEMRPGRVLTDLAAAAFADARCLALETGGIESALRLPAC